MYKITKVIPLILLLMSGCSTARTAEVPPGQINSAEQRQLPYEVSVLHELNDGRTLYVAGVLEARTRWSPAETVLKLTTYREGTVVAEGTFTVDSVLSPDQGVASSTAADGQPGKSGFALSLPSSTFSDYQLEVLWGAEAAPYLVSLAASRPVIEVRNARLNSVPCSGQGCRPELNVSAELFNSGSQIINKISLGIGLVWENSGQDPGTVSPEEESGVDLESMALNPGASREIRLSLDDAAPDAMLPEGFEHRLRPVIRVKSYGG